MPVQRDTWIKWGSGGGLGTTLLEGTVHVVGVMMVQAGETSGSPASPRRCSWSSVLAYHLCRLLAVSAELTSIDESVSCPRLGVAWAEKLGLLASCDLAIVQASKLAHPAFPLPHHPPARLVLLFLPHTMLISFGGLWYQSHSPHGCL